MTTGSNINDFYVYRHTFAENRIYIGKGRKGRAFRFDHRNPYWQNCYAKYGEPTVEILSTDMDEITAFELEVFCIQEYIDNGYKLAEHLINMSLGGEGSSGRIVSKETKSKQSKAHKGKQYSLGYKFTDKQREAVSKRFKGASNPNAKSVVQLDPVTYTLLAVFTTAREAAQSVNATNQSNIISVCKGKRSIANGYYWQYSTDYWSDIQYTNWEA